MRTSLILSLQQSEARRQPLSLTYYLPSRITSSQTLSMATMMATTLTCGRTCQTECKQATWTSLARAPAGLRQISASWAARAGGRQSLKGHGAPVCFDRAVSRQSRRRRHLRVSALFKEPDPDQKGSPLEGELAGIIFKVGILCRLATGLAMPGVT